MWSVYEMNLRNERQQTREKRFVPYTRKQAGMKAAVGPEVASSTLSDVARLAGVSKMTASRVLNGFPKVSAEKMNRDIPQFQSCSMSPTSTRSSCAKGKERDCQEG